jgi:hypothetical protein
LKLRRSIGTAGGLPYRIARWPSFYRGAIAMVVDERDEKVVGETARSWRDTRTILLHQAKVAGIVPVVGEDEQGDVKPFHLSARGS